MSTVTASIDPFPEITAGITLAGEVVKLTEQQLAVLNSPQEQQARLNAEIQRQKDQNARDADAALATGKLDAVETDLSP